MLRSLTHIQARRVDLALTPLRALELRRNRTPGRAAKMVRAESVGNEACQSERAPQGLRCRMTASLRATATFARLDAVLILANAISYSPALGGRGRSSEPTQIRPTLGVS